MNEKLTSNELRNNLAMEAFLAEREPGIDTILLIELYTEFAKQWNETPTELKVRKFLGGDNDWEDWEREDLGATVDSFCDSADSDMIGIAFTTWCTEQFISLGREHGVELEIEDFESFLNAPYEIADKLCKVA